MNTKPISRSFLFAVGLVATLLVASFQPATATYTALSILAYPSEAKAETRSLARVYAEPNDASQLLNVLPPGAQIQILGLSENGAWIALANGSDNAIAGWLSIGDVKQNLIVGSARSLVRVHQQPGADSQVTSVLTPASKVQVLGHNPDNAWIAISRPSASGAAINWVSAGELKLPDVIAITSSLAMFYLKPDASSRITNVLPPTQKVILIGRDHSGTWFAAADFMEGRFIGWARISDLIGGSNRTTLPMLPVR